MLINVKMPTSEIYHAHNVKKPTLVEITCSVELSQNKYYNLGARANTIVFCSEQYNVASFVGIIYEDFKYIAHVS